MANPKAKSRTAVAIPQAEPTLRQRLRDAYNAERARVEAPEVGES